MKQERCQTHIQRKLGDHTSEEMSLDTLSPDRTESEYHHVMHALPCNAFNLTNFLRENESDPAVKIIYLDTRSVFSYFSYRTSCQRWKIIFYRDFMATSTTVMSIHSLTTSAMISGLLVVWIGLLNLQSFKWITLRMTSVVNRMSCDQVLHASSWLCHGKSVPMHISFGIAKSSKHSTSRSFTLDPMHGLVLCKPWSCCGFTGSEWSLGTTGVCRRHGFPKLDLSQTMMISLLAFWILRSWSMGVILSHAFPTVIWLHYWGKGLLLQDVQVKMMIGVHFMSTCKLFSTFS